MTSQDNLWSVLKPTLRVAWVFSFFINLMILGPTLYMLQIYDRVLASRSEPTLYMLTLIVGMALIAMAVVDMARGRLMVLAGRNIDEILSKGILKYLIRNASTVNRVIPLYGLKDVATLRGFLTGNNVIALFDVPWLIFFIVLIFVFHPWMGAFSVLSALILLLLAWINEKANREELNLFQDTTRRAGQLMEQGVRNADVLNSMGMTSRFAVRWEMLNREALNRMQATSSRMGSVLALSKFVRQGAQVGMMGLGSYLIIHDNLSPGIMIAGTILLGRAMAPVESLIGNWNGLVAARSAHARIAKLLPVIFESKQRQPLPSPLGQIHVERIFLAGSDNDHPILRQIDFHLPAGKSMAILGPSGSGKSSLAKLIVGVWAATSGHVRIDGAEIDHWNPGQLGQHVGYLPQDVELFPGTIAENIGRFDSENRDAIIDAAKAAHAYELILRLPDGFDTRLGEGGIQLSAGQAQRIGLARALYGAPCIIVLDEPNANLDAEGEEALLQALAERKASGSTVVLITHKPSLVGGMDYLLVLREGRVEIMGPRAEVLARLSGQSASVQDNHPRQASNQTRAESVI